MINRFDTYKKLYKFIKDYYFIGGALGTDAGVQTIEQPLPIFEYTLGLRDIIFLYNYQIENGINRINPDQLNRVLFTLLNEQLRNSPAENREIYVLALRDLENHNLINDTMLYRDPDNETEMDPTIIPEGQYNNLINIINREH